MLQKERLVVSRLGFPDRAMELDRQITIMTEKAKQVRSNIVNTIIKRRVLKLL